MGIKTKTIKSDFEDLIDEMIGKEVEVDGIVPAEQSMPGKMVFVDREEFVESVLKSIPGVLVTNSELYRKFFSELSCTILLVKDISLAHAFMRQKYTDRNVRNEEWSGVHPSATVHETAMIPDSCILGPGVVIGKDVKVGENTVILSNSVVEHNVTIGSNTVIHPLVFIGYNTEIGNDVTINPGVVIGSEGFGFARNKSGGHVRIPQTGRVVIENDVIIGSGTCIDRAAYDVTRLRRGVRLDNLVHIAHNCDIGEDAALAGQNGISGSTVIGKRVMTGGQVGFHDHLKIPDDSIFVHRAAVTENPPGPGLYAGSPLQPINEYFRNSSAIKDLHNMRKAIKMLEKRIKQLEEAGD